VTDEGGSPVSAPRGSPSRGLALPPLPFYVLKAGVTRTQSAVWFARSHRRPVATGIRILFYHRVSDDRDELAVTRNNFRRQMDYLAGQGYRVVDVLDAATLLDAGDAPVKTVALSFDDGYQDVADHATPLLAERGFKATVFVAPAVIDGTASFAWYRNQPPLLGWEDMKALDAESPLSFEAHSLTHPNLLELTDDDARLEIFGSKLALEERLGRAVTAFSYPAGLFGPRERRLVDEAGFRVAVSCEPGLNQPGTDRFALRRRQIDARDRLFDFRAKVGGGHDSPPPFRGAYRRFRFGADDPSPIAASSRR
jgi:peptidoglycan/xylan/chitin deacetylase (PgdA/CDA1 family)